MVSQPCEPAQNVWAVGDNGTVLKWNGTAWVAQSVGVTNSSLYSVWGADANNVWAVGSGGTIGFQARPDAGKGGHERQLVLSRLSTLSTQWCCSVE
jgi:hypothetical protein